MSGVAGGLVTVLRTAVMLALSGVLLVACSGEFGWTEEVRLGSGEVIVVKRTAQAAPFGEIGGPGGWESEAMTVEIIRPKRADDPAVWNFPYVPVLFDRDPQTKEWFMVATFYTCERWYELGEPKLPYGEWRFRNGQWQRVELAPIHIGRPANMLTSIRSGGEPDHTLASKEQIMSDVPAAPKYLSVFDGWNPFRCLRGPPKTDLEPARSKP